jgi:hypothetical protein
MSEEKVVVVRHKRTLRPGEVLLYGIIFRFVAWPLLKKGWEFARVFASGLAEGAREARENEEESRVHLFKGGFDTGYGEAASELYAYLETGAVVRADGAGLFDVYVDEAKVVEAGEAAGREAARLADFHDEYGRWPVDRELIAWSARGFEYTGGGAS